MRQEGSVYLGTMSNTLDWIVNQVTDRMHKSDSLKEVSDQNLISSAQKGDKKCFEVLVRRYQKQVYNIVFQMLRNHEQTADVTQETFLKVYRALDSFDNSREFRPWLLRIARNTTLNLIRARKYEASLDDDSLYKEPVTESDASTEIDRKLSQKSFAQALSTIPANQKEAFLLKYQQDLSYNEISEIMGISISSIKSLLFRARENLRKKLVITDTGIETKDEIEEDGK